MRIKRSVNKQKHKKAILKAAKGYRGAKSTLVRVANQAVMKSGQYAYVGRRLRKRDIYPMKREKKINNYLKKRGCKSPFFVAIIGRIGKWSRGSRDTESGRHDASAREECGL